MIVLGKFRKKPTKERIIQAQRATQAALEKMGGKRIGGFFTIGRYDYVVIVERPSETFDESGLAQSIRRVMEVSDDLSTETLIGVKDDEVLNLM
jgi:uncharacterized protein with GYD domain